METNPQKSAITPTHSLQTAPIGAGKPTPVAPGPDRTRARRPLARRWAGLAVCMAALLQAGTAWAAADDDLMTRGNYLMNGVVACANCHMARNDKGEPQFDKGLSGGMFFDDPAFKAYAANITPDVNTGIGSWTDEQLRNAIRNGVRPDGSLIGPPMPIPFYRNLSDHDLTAIITYLKAQPAVKHQVPASTYNFPLPPNYGPPVTNVASPQSTDTVNYGRYLAQIGHCMDCHTPRAANGRLILARLGAGGQLIKWPAGGEAVTPNLTPGPGGLSSWSDAQITRAIQEGIAKDGHHLMRIMAFDWYKNIDAADMKALVAYLRSLPPQATETHDHSSHAAKDQDATNERRERVMHAVEVHRIRKLLE